MTEFLNKITSGRFLLTLITGGVFAYAVLTKQIEPQATASIIAMVFVSYFNKKNGNGDNRPTG